MHILILPSFYPHAGRSNDGSFFVEQAEALARYGHKVTVMPYIRDAVNKTHVTKVERNGFTEYTIHYRNLKFHLTPLVILWAMVQVLLKMPRKERPNIIHVHVFRAARYGRVLSRMFHVPYVVTEHVTWFERNMLSNRELREARRAYEKAAGVIAVSTGLRRTITPYCRKPIDVIPNLVHRRFFDGGLHHGSEDGVFRFLTVSTLDHKKGQDILLRAFAGVVAEEPDVFLAVCGEGPELHNLQALCEELGITDKVEFTGLIPREEVARRLRESQVFALASRAETFGVVFVEAMACGVPIVMTKTSAWELLAVPGTGLAVEIDDIPAFREAMLQVMHTYGDYSPQVISEYCRNSFSEEAVCRRITDKYEEVLRR